MKSTSTKIYFFLDINDTLKTVCNEGMKLNSLIRVGAKEFYKIYEVDFLKDKSYYTTYLKNFSTISFDLDSFYTATPDILRGFLKQYVEPKDYENLIVQATFKSKIYELLTITDNAIFFTDESKEILRVQYPAKNLKIFRV